jgi:hypothetical protein
MKLIIGKPDGSELVLAEQVGAAWRPNPTLRPRWRRSSKALTRSSSKCGSRSLGRTAPASLLGLGRTRKRIAS